MIEEVRLRRAAPLLLLAGALTAGCTQPADGESPAEQPRRVTVVTDRSWELPAELRAAFERQSDLELVVRQVGDTPAELVQELRRHRGKPFADVVLGIDTSTAHSALATGTLAPYTSPEANKGQQRFSVDKRQRLSAVDLLAVCVNVDEGWFAEQGSEPPQTLADLTRVEYAELLVLPDPATSAEGLAFLLGTVARYGDGGWRKYWQRLKANGVLVVESPVQVDERYTAAAGSGTAGDRPIAVGPAAKPALLPEEVDGDPETSALPRTCHQQVRYAGVLAEAANSQRAGMLLDFLLTQQFQQALPEAFGSYPVREGVELPDGWDELAPQPEDATTLPARAADAGRKRWIAQWQAVMS